jgi:hypothetical protein
VTLQINVSPGGLRHIRHAVPNQLRQWYGQVQEVVFSLESRRSEGRYGKGWDEEVVPLREFLEEVCSDHSKARISVVDYSRDASEAVSAAFFGGREVPEKDHSGAPILAYFQALLVPRFDHIFHIDSDMLFGGGSQTWAAEARALLAERPDVLFCSPLSGPPTADGHIPPAVQERMARWGGMFYGREPGEVPTYAFGDVSSRIWFVDRVRLRERIAPLRLRRARLRWIPGHKGAAPSTLRARVRARIKRRPHSASTEDTLSRAMRDARMVRLDYLGQKPGMWTLHPVAHDERFYGELPRLVEIIESGDLPEGQLGDYNINDSLLTGQSAAADVVDLPLWRRAVSRIS